MFLGLDVLDVEDWGIHGLMYDGTFICIMFGVSFNGEVSFYHYFFACVSVYVCMLLSCLAQMLCWSLLLLHTSSIFTFYSSWSKGIDAALCCG